MANPTQYASPHDPNSQDPRGGQPAAVSNVLGNIILVVILLCLISIPFLVYFTDTTSRLKRNLLELGEAYRGEPKVVERIVEKRVEVPIIVETAASEEDAAPPKEVLKPSEPATTEIQVSMLPRKEYDVAELFNGLSVRTTLDLQKGDVASKERDIDKAYEFEVKLKVRVPKPNQSVEELAALNPHLPKILPDLPKLLETGKVSPLFQRLYDLKHQRLKDNLTRLDQLETRHNYFDCETMLDLTHPTTGQKVLMMQGEMDVVADGSDGDRLPTIDDYVSLSTHYQPMTSYGWAKRTDAENPLIDRWQKNLKEAKNEYSIKGLSAERNRYLKNRIDQLTREINDLQARSYLVAEADPFIVLPLSTLGQSGSHAPSIGDYAVVIHEDKVYPALCGDAGPSWKMGEASLLMAQTISNSASPYNRPVSDLKVTYLVFPGSKEGANEPPDLAKWKAKCQDFVQGLGGLGTGYKLHDWRDIVAERRAVRECKGLIGKVAQAIASADGAVAEAKKAVASAEAKVSSANQALSAGTGSQGGVDSAKQVLEKVKEDKAAAEAAAARTKDAAKAVEAAVEIAKMATSKPLPTPKTETTDVALEALSDANKVYAEALEDAQEAREAASRAKSMVD